MVRPVAATVRRVWPWPPPHQRPPNARRTSAQSPPTARTARRRASQPAEFGQDLAAGGPATCTFAGKDHDLFARFQGTLSEEISRDRFEEEWSNFVSAYFPGGKDDPNLLMLRMDLGAAEIYRRLAPLADLADADAALAAALDRLLAEGRAD